MKIFDNINHFHSTCCDSCSFSWHILLLFILHILFRLIQYWNYISTLWIITNIEKANTALLLCVMNCIVMFSIYKNIICSNTIVVCLHHQPMILFPHLLLQGYEPTAIMLCKTFSYDLCITPVGLDSSSVTLLKHRSWSKYHTIDMTCCTLSNKSFAAFGFFNFSAI